MGGNRKENGVEDRENLVEGGVVPCEDENSVVVGGERENIISFGKHWGVFDDFNKRRLRG